MENYLDKAIDIIKNIDTENILEVETPGVVTKVIEEQKTYYWIRVYLKDENPNIEIGDDIEINYVPNNEILTSKFICFNKKGLDKDIVNQIKNYNPEDDKKTLCLMVDEKLVNDGTNIDFIRTLFGFSKHYQEQVYRRSDLLLIIKNKNIVLDYYDITF